MDRLKEWIDKIQKEFIFGKKRIYKRDKYFEYQGVIYRISHLKSGDLYLRPKDILRNDSKIELIAKGKKHKTKSKNGK